MPSGSIPQRLSWAMATMAIGPSDHVLEIGCGRGVAAEVVCRHLTGGRFVALDRSTTMAEAAAWRNRASVAAGRAVFLATALNAADFTGERFDTVFAVNVNLFWVDSALPELELIRRSLKRNGAMYLFHERPQPTRAEAVAQRVWSFLGEHGFATTMLRTTTPGTGTRQARTMVCVIARPQRASAGRGASKR